MDWLPAQSQSRSAASRYSVMQSLGEQWLVSFCTVSGNCISDLHSCAPSGPAGEDESTAADLTNYHRRSVSSGIWPFSFQADILHMILHEQKSRYAGSL